jgi:hypothetical protein
LRDSFTAEGAGDAGIGIKGIAVALTGASQRHVAHVLPLTSGGGGNTFIVMNNNGDLISDAAIQVAGLHNVDASWFVL